MIDLRNMDINELYDMVERYGEKKFRAKQIFEWLHKNHANNFNDLKNLPKKFLAEISDKYCISQVNLLSKIQSNQDSTIKYLFEFENFAIIESVRMKHGYGNTVCVSTQAGCNMACLFCASAKGGKLRNLSAGEMTAQVYSIENDIGERVSNVVLMGSGEPFDNYENSLKFIKLLNSEHGANISQRHITLSTCGLIDGIDRLAKETIDSTKLQITLAVSLHAPNDEIRQKIMPIARKYPFSALLDSCRNYVFATNRRITFEYAMIKGLNDTPAAAEELAIKLNGILCHVNIIPLNETSGNLKKSSAEDMERFVNILSKNGVNVSIRKEKGADISAACGQLRNQVWRR